MVRILFAFKAWKYFGCSVLDLFGLRLEIEDVKANITKLFKNTLPIKDQSKMDNYDINA